jgi:hypothetical protein
LMAVEQHPYGLERGVGVAIGGRDESSKVVYP